MVFLCKMIVRTLTKLSITKESYLHITSQNISQALKQLSTYNRYRHTHPTRATFSNTLTGEAGLFEKKASWMLHKACYLSYSCLLFSLLFSLIILCIDVLGWLPINLLVSLHVVITWYRLLQRAVPCCVIDSVNFSMI